MTCRIPTIRSGAEVKASYPSAFQANNAIENNLNPDLKNCGSLPGCRGCSILRSVAQENLTIGLPGRVASFRPRVGELI